MVWEESDWLYSPTDDTDADPTFYCSSDDLLSSSSSESDVQRVIKRKSVLSNTNTRCSNKRTESYVKPTERIQLEKPIKECYVKLAKRIKLENSLKECYVRLAKCDNYLNLYNCTDVRASSGNDHNGVDFGELRADDTLTTSSNDTSGFCSSDALLDGNFCETKNVDIVEKVSPVISIKMSRKKFNDGKVDEKLKLKFLTDNGSRIDISKLLEIYRLKNASIRKLKKAYLKKICNLDIKITWDVPVSHETFCYYDMFESGFERNCQQFTVDEDNTIIQNWDDFKHIYDFEDPELFFPGVLNKKTFLISERRKFVQFLARGLPSRQLKSVYLRFGDLFHQARRKGRFTYGEDRIIAEVMKLYKMDLDRIDPMKLLIYVLERKGYLLKTRMNFLEDYKVTADVDWNLDFCSNLIQELLIECNANRVEELLVKYIRGKNWQVVSDKLKCCRYRLEAFWLYRLSIQLFSKRPIYRNKLREKIIIWFYKRRKDFKTMDDVEWIVLCKHLKIPSPWFVYQKFRKMLITYVPQRKLFFLKKSIIYLYRHFLPLLQSGQLKDHCLRRLKYTDGKLVPLD